MLQIYARKMDELKQHACAVELLNDILLRLGREAYKYPPECG